MNIASNNGSGLAERIGPLAFIHIPKCSGTAFENYLLTCPALREGSECFVGVNGQGQLERFEEYARRKAGSPLLYGHVSHRDYRFFFPCALIATFLRDPIQRTISQYKSWHDPDNWNTGDAHYQGASPEVFAALKFSQQATLEEFVTTDIAYIHAGALGNIQTLMLSSLAGVSLAEHLESAKDNLRRSHFFGITEKFSESVGMFRSTFIGAPEYAERPSSENRSKVKVEGVSAAVVDKIKAQVVYDVQLYEFALELFEQRMRCGPPTTYLMSQFTAEAPSFAELSILLGLLESGRGERAYLESRIDELVCLYESITNSRAWKLIELFRRIKARG